MQLRRHSDRGAGAGLLGCLQALVLLAVATTSQAATFNYLPAPIDVSPVVAGAWTDVDVSANVPVGATGVIVQWVNLSVAGDPNYGVRMKGSTDNWAFDGEAKTSQQGWLMTGLNAARVFQVFTGDTGVKTYLVGYTMAGVTFFVNRIDKSTATTGTWVDVGIAADTGSDTAIGAIFHVDCQAGSSVGYGLRKKGSTDNQLQTLRANMMNLGLVGVDATETAQQQIAATTVDLFLVGYVTEGAVFFTNAIDKSTGTTGSYQPVDITNDVGAGVANGAFVEIQPSDGTRRNTAIRPNGSAYDYYGEVSHQFAVVGIDAGDVFEQKIQLNTMDLYLTGYSLADGAAAFRVKSGSYVGTGAALSINGLGFQPDVVIVDGDGGGADASIKTSTMAGLNSKQFDNSAVAFDTTHIVSLDADGFSLGTDIDVNQNGITYYWVAFKAAPGHMKVGTYAGSAVAQNVTGVGFTPAYLMVISPNATNTMQRSTPMPANFCLDFAGAGYNNSILNMQPSGFGLGTHASVAGAGTTFHYVAWNNVPGKIAVGSYVGNNADLRNITGVGFWPEYVIVDRSSDVGGATGTGVGNAPAHKTAASGVSTDSTTLFNSNLAETDNIQALQADGFQLGTHCRVNGNGAPAPCNNPAPVNYYWMAFGPHRPQVRYRSIGNTAVTYGTAGTTGAGTRVDVTSGLASVTGLLGTTWLTANRGRGDVITIPCDNPPTCTLPTAGVNYMILSVGSNSSLQLSQPYQGAGNPSASYLIRRQFSTFAAWEDCVDGPPGTACPYFPVTSASLVSDDRREIGIAYKDSVFTPAAQVLFVGATTDATHSITLTADGINRHNGVQGAGVVIDGATNNRGFRIEDNNYTVEWLEFRNIYGVNDEASILIRGGGTSQTGVLLQNLLIHDFFDGTANVIKGIGVQGNGGKVATIRNVMIWNGDQKGIEGDAVNDTITIENCTVDSMANYGIDAFHSQFIIRNTISTRNPSGDFVRLQADGSLTGSNNTSSDLTAGAAPAVFANPQTSAVAAALYLDSTGPVLDLHLQPAAVAVNTGLDLSSSFLFDIDSQRRPAGAAWDRGADESGGTTEVKLMTLEALPGDGEVRLAWRTASELSNLGFHLYRAGSSDGPWTRLTASLIPGLGSSPVGQTYSFRDTGLLNGTRYFYRLEDVNASSVVTSHGPVSAVPQAGVASDDADDAGKDRKRKGAAGATCPSFVLSAYAASVSATAASLRCTRHGDPEASTFAVLSRDARQATLELRTLGFYALHEPAGTVRLFVPGFDLPQDPHAPALPLRRALVDAVVGRKVELAGVRALDLAAFPGLAPSALGTPEMQLSGDGTARAGRRAGRTSLRLREAELARLAPSVFQGEAKSAVVELSPLRFDAARRQIVLARTLRARLLFTGREAGESGKGSRGRGRGPRQPAAEQLLARLYTTSRGLHAASFEQLFPGERRGLPLSQLRLERLGEAVPFHVEPDTDSFAPGGRLYFFADRVAASTAFSSEVAWELVRASGGRLMARASAAPSGGALVSASTGSASFETNRLYQPGLLDAPDPWLWEGLGAGATRAKAFSLNGVDAASPQGAELAVFVQGGSESGQPVDHHVSLSLNGMLVGEAQFAGKRPYRISLSVPASLLREGTNELAVTNVADTGVASLFFLDRFSVGYPQRPATVAGRFEGVWGGSGSAAVTSDAAAAAVVDVTSAEDPGVGSSAPVWLSGYGVAPGRVTFRAEAGRRYLVVAPSGVLTPRVAAPVASSLRSVQNQADYLVIAPRAFLSAAEPLLARRADQGLVARAIAAEEIFDEFGYGEPSAEAIRGFLGFAFHSWARPSPRYVLLLGDTNYDPRNFMGTSPASPLPGLFIRTSYLWTVSDPLLAAVNGEDALPDLAIGRLPASTLDEASRLVAKLLAWEQSAQGFSGPATLVADDPDLGGDFEANVADIARSFLADRSPQLLLLRELGAATRPRVQDALDSGLSFLSYVGHGGAAVWASENVWNSWDAASLQVQSRQPLLVTMNCLNGYFVAPAFDSLAESLVKPEGRGAIAAFSPSGLSLDAPAHEYHRAVMAEITSGRHARLGDAFLAAQTAYGRTGLMPELLSIYHLFGDPAMPLP